MTGRVLLGGFYPSEVLAHILHGAAISRRRRGQLEELVESLESSVRDARADAARERTKVGDLKRHLADRDRHIRNLEATERERLGVG